MYTKRKKSSHDRVLMADFHDCDDSCVDGCPYGKDSSQRDSQDIGDQLLIIYTQFLRVHYLRVKNYYLVRFLRFIFYLINQPV